MTDGAALPSEDAGASADGHYAKIRGLLRARLRSMDVELDEQTMEAMLSAAWPEFEQGLGDALLAAFGGATPTEYAGAAAAEQLVAEHRSAALDVVAVHSESLVARLSSWGAVHQEQLGDLLEPPA
ncbi:hypothetical protein [Rathayibacter sp. Leaf296]|uniref:hypothetical protein n=1 Tax=Rathayibacter sp. Leaf296 TaxID=1736327 RepID=UPI000702A950|nr:hypothetical protein [Rathayibacter sp. Leaf296]KQQ09775.1 hypothetical protein ASF46_01225 [Rathayibacter sp. Leaf296]